MPGSIAWRGAQRGGEEYAWCLGAPNACIDYLYHAHGLCEYGWIVGAVEARTFNFQHIVGHSAPHYSIDLLAR